jgi:hypothetical protein
MKASSVYLIAFNLVMIILFFYIRQDIASRVVDWYSPYECHPYIGVSCYTPTISYGFLYYIISASCTNLSGCRGEPPVPGSVTLNWSQAVLLVAAVADGITALQYLRTEAKGVPNSNQLPTENPSDES